MGTTETLIYNTDPMLLILIASGVWLCILAYLMLKAKSRLIAVVYTSVKTERSYEAAICKLKRDKLECQRALQAYSTAYIELDSNLYAILDKNFPDCDMSRVVRTDASLDHLECDHIASVCWYTLNRHRKAIGGR